MIHIFNAINFNELERAGKSNGYFIIIKLPISYNSNRFIAAMHEFFMNLSTVYYQSLPKGFEGNTFVWLLSSRCINWLRLCIVIVVVRPFSCMYALCCVSLSPSLVLYRFYLFNILKSQVTNQKWRNGGKEKVTRGNKKNILR